MKKILCVALMLVALCSTAFAADLVPLITIDPADFANGTYSVGFEFSETEAGKINLWIMQQDYYDMAAVEALQAGDTVTTGNTVCTVETVEVTDDGWYQLNGGFANPTANGVTLVPEADAYTSLEDDMYYTETLQGTATFALADTVRFRHFIYDIENGLSDEYTDEDIPASELEAAINDAVMYYYPCIATIEDGVVVEMLFNYCS